MCLIAFAVDSYPRYQLVLMANRDEFRSRGTSPAGFWPDAPHVLADPFPFADELLPDTGIGPERERFLSPLFITGEVYATRSTTVLLVGHDGEAALMEQSHDLPLQTRTFTLQLAAEPGL